MCPPFSAKRFTGTEMVGYKLKVILYLPNSTKVEKDVPVIPFTPPYLGEYDKKYQNRHIQWGFTKHV